MIAKYLEEYKKFIVEHQRIGKIPGLATVLFEDGQSTIFTSGVADIADQRQVTALTLFELGSMSKAFTYLAAIIMAKQNKLDFEKTVQCYLPWFHVYHKGKLSKTEEVEIKIRDLVYHTSGIMTQSLLNIKEDSSESALLDTAKQINGTQLLFMPGMRYEYSSNNTNLLACVMEIAANMPFDQLIREKLLLPLGLHHTYVYRNEVDSNSIASGHKYMFWKARKYHSPVFRGNSPAGHMLSCAKDMERWLKIQMGQIEVENLYREAIIESHCPQLCIPAEKGFYVAAGWDVHENGNLIKFTGRTANYSSIILFDSQIQCGICILANMASSMTYYIGENLLKIPKFSSIPSYEIDRFRCVDNLFSFLTIFTGILFCLSVILFIFVTLEKISLRFGNFMGIVTILWFIISFLFLLCIPNYYLKYYKSICPHYFKALFRQGRVWLSSSIYIALLLYFLTHCLIVMTFFK